ncbi:MAG: peptidase inhibitor family I36 protein [Egibacteraceae bacterium]
MRKTLGSMFTGAFMLAMLGAAALPAGAQDGQCPVGEICLFEDSNHSGDENGSFRTGSDDLTTSPPINDKASSYWNRSDRPFCLYEDVGYDGDIIQRVLPGESKNLYGPSNDKVSSLRPC